MFLLVAMAPFMLQQLSGEVVTNGLDRAPSLCTTWPLKEKFGGSGGLKEPVGLKDLPVRKALSGLFINKIHFYC